MQFGLHLLRVSIVFVYCSSRSTSSGSKSASSFIGVVQIVNDSNYSTLTENRSRMHCRVQTYVIFLTETASKI